MFTAINFKINLPFSVLPTIGVSITNFTTVNFYCGKP